MEELLKNEFIVAITDKLTKLANAAEVTIPELVQQIVRYHQVSSVVYLAIGIAMLIFAVILTSIIYNKKNGEIVDDAILFFIFLGDACLYIASLFFICINLPEAIGWWTVPTIKVLEYILKQVKG